jgi:hypothetical protein
VKNSLKGTVKVPASTPIVEKQGTVMTFNQLEVSVDAFTCEKTGVKFVEFR